MEDEKKYIRLDEIDANIEFNTSFSYEALRTLDTYSQDQDSLLRVMVARILVNATDEQGEGILLRMLKDQDALVRTEACDSLSISSSIETYEALRKIIQSDRNGMVRGYAILSLGNISAKLGLAENTISFLEDILQDEKVVFTTVCLYEVLYILGKEKYLHLLAEKISTKKYQNRCAVANGLRVVLNEENSAFIKSVLLSREKVERSFAVISTISEILEHL